MKNDLKSLVLNGVPQTTITLSDGKEVKLRAMLVRELKLLMMAMESGDWIETLEQVMEQCILTDDIDIKALPTGDLENMFVKVHILSKGKHTLPVKYECEVEVEKTDEETEETYTEPCGGEMRVVIDLNKATMSEPSVEPLIKVSNEIVIKMRYPTGKEQQYFNIDSDAEMFNMCARCIESISINDETQVVGEDISEEEIIEVFEYFDRDTFDKMAEFINDTPMLSYPIAMECPKCKTKHTQVLKGLADFFE